MTIRSEIPVRNELGRLGRSRSVSVWLGERSDKVQSVRRGPLGRLPVLVGLLSLQLFHHSHPRVSAASSHSPPEAAKEDAA